MKFWIGVLFGFGYFVASRFIYPLLTFEFNEVVFDIMFFGILFICYLFRKNINNILTLKRKTEKPKNKDV